MNTIKIDACADYIFGCAETEAGPVLFDTVPAAYADEWLEKTCGCKAAAALILCSSQPFPECVRSFARRFPDAVIYGPEYALYQLKGILGEELNTVSVRSARNVTIGELVISLDVVSQAGKGSYITAAACDDCFGGSGEEIFEPVRYERTTVAVVYVSGLDYTEVIARKLAEGVEACEDIDTKLLDITSENEKDIINAMLGADAIMIGTSSVRGEAHRKIWEMLIHIPKELIRRKPVRVFGSFTENSGGIDNIVSRLDQLEVAMDDRGFSVQYKPNEVGLESIFEYGYAFGCTITGKVNTHQSRLVKCIVCGLVFDSALGECPLCGAGLDKCVPVEGEEINYKIDTDRTYVIIGASGAGIAAAEAIRGRDKTGRVVMISKEDCLPINRPRLSKSLAVIGRLPESFPAKEEQWYQDNNIELLRGASAERIDTSARTVSYKDAEGEHTVRYDRLIYAAGAECRTFPIEGDDAEGIMTVRHLEDVQKIMGELGIIKHAVVIGGGVLGLEIASELKKMRIKTTVLEAGVRLMPRQLNEEASGVLLEKIREFGVDIRLSSGAEAFEGSPRVTGVRTKEGDVIPAELVILSCGNQANTALAAEAGIECGRSIPVDLHMRTNIEDIFACGDCASVGEVNYQLWTEACEQGRIAGANAAGDTVRYDPVPYGTSFEAMNVRLFSMGDLGSGDGKYSTVEYRDELAGCLRRYWFKDGRLCGGLLWGNVEKSLQLTDAVICGSRYEDIADEL